MDALDPRLLNPDGQPPLPVAAAEGYARTVTTWAQAPLPSGVRAMRDLAYGPHRLQRCNVFAPAGARGAPVLVFWHGGGWTHGYRDWITFMAAPVVARGIVLVAPSYRLAPEHPLPAGFDDALALLAWLQHEAPAWGGAPDRLLLAGHSAGGHLATLAALRSDARTAAGVPAHAVRACLPVSGIHDLHHAEPPPGSLEERVYTQVLARDPPHLDTLLSPLYWAAGNRVPFLLSWGERDSPRVIRSNQRLAALLQAQPGAPCETACAPGLDHFQTHTALQDPAHAWYDRLAAVAQSPAGGSPGPSSAISSSSVA